MATPTVRESILNSIKKMLGIYQDVTSFDDELILHINSVIASLSQMGIGPSNSEYRITNSSNVWTELLSDDKRLESVKTYIYMKVRLIFDTPPQSSLIDAYERQIKEFEWRNFVIKDNDRITEEALLEDSLGED